MNMSNYDVVYDIFVRKPFEKFKKIGEEPIFLKMDIFSVQTTGLIQ